MSSRIPRNKTNRRSQQLGHSDGPSSSPAPPQEAFTLVSLMEASKLRKPYGTGNIPFPQVDVYGPEGPMVQLGVPASSTRLGVERGGVYSPARSTVLDDEGRSAHGQKKQKQWARWTTEILPSLVEPYLALLRNTDSLRTPVTPNGNLPCKCGGTRKKMEVKGLYFDRISTVLVCPCQAAVELISLGLFPCAPLRPSLAVDLNVLGFVRELFLRSAPNNTAWCEALEVFLESRKYALHSKDPLRRRFANAFHWYEKLNHLKDRCMLDAIAASRSLVFTELQKLTTETGENESHGHSRPSDYLRAKCPLCFGSSTAHRTDQEVDLIVCVDANFTQKRRRNPFGTGRGPPDAHADTAFLSEEKVEQWRERVESVRPPQTQPQTSDQRDGYEGSIRVPNSVLDECQNSFTAADEKRTKASTQFFADTGLMAILCRHDIVLWLVNMTTPGERQYYALALLSELFLHLPPTTAVGCLYDIGCQVDRSCIKWNWLDIGILKRLVWAVSVFHAFGHQWPCQLIYHPRKRTGFGLSDGEGCERFWSSIKLLIPSLRVSSHFQRLFSLDRQVHYLNWKSLCNLGIWLKRKWLQCQAKKTAALLVLANVGVARDELEAEWELQVSAQTQPLKKQSKKAGNKAIEEILSLLDVRKALQQSRTKLDTLLSSDLLEDSIDDLRDERDALQENLDKVDNKIKVKRNALGIDGRLNLKRFLDNQFLQRKMNASALKQRICARLRERKFELDRLERAYRHTTSNEIHLHNHIKSSVKRHEPTITGLVTKYNKLCDEMEVMKRDPTLSTPGPVPSKLNKEGLFKLDVDDSIWEDVVWNDEEGAGSVPKWLGDEETRTGIKAMLELKRCEEEEHRLSLERCSLQEWFFEEWSCVVIAIDNALQSPDLMYQLLRHRSTLLKILQQWRCNVQEIPPLYDLDDTWGPLQEDLQEEQSEMEIVGNTLEDSSSDDLAGDDSEIWSGDDEDLMEAIEWAHMKDVYQREYMAQE